MVVFGRDLEDEGQLEEVVDQRHDVAPAFDGQCAVLIEGWMRVRLTIYEMWRIEGVLNRRPIRTGGQKSSCMSTTRSAGRNGTTPLSVVAESSTMEL